jgi:hypothetical protein
MKRSANRNRKKNKISLNLSGLIKFPGHTGRWTAGIALIVMALVLVLGFFEMAGMIGNWFSKSLAAATGGAVFVLPFVLLAAGAVCFVPKKKISVRRWFWPGCWFGWD